MKPNKEELLAKAEQRRKETEARVQELMKEDLLDEDGYPSEAALEIVRIWDWMNPREYFNFIKSIWWAADWGWDEGEEPHELSNYENYKDTMVYRYHISTGGWSGNESIVRAMQENDWMWHMNWVQSRRGGHYIFELREF